MFCTCIIDFYFHKLPVNIQHLTIKKYAVMFMVIMSYNILLNMDMLVTQGFHLFFQYHRVQIFEVPVNFNC